MDQDVDYTLASSLKLKVSMLVDHGTEDGIETNHYFL